MGEFDTKDRLIDLNRRTDDLRVDGARRMIRPAIGNKDEYGDFILAQVSNESGVTPFDSSFGFMNAKRFEGFRDRVAPVMDGGEIVYDGEEVVYDGGAGTALNFWGLAYDYEQWVWLGYNKDLGAWIPTPTGEGSGDEVIYFELVDDKSYTQLAVFAKPVDEDGNLVSGADSFWVVDDTVNGDGHFYGLAAYSDADSEAASWTGYRGHAVRFSDNLAGGLAGYRIISMEGPQDFFKATMTEAVGETDEDQAGVTYSGAINISASPFTDRRPQFVGSSPNVMVFDDLGIAANWAAGDEVICKWNKRDEHYIFWRRKERVLEVGLLIAEIPAASIPGSGDWSITWGTQSNAVVRLKRKVDNTGYEEVLDGESAVTLDGRNNSGTPMRGSSTIPVAVLGFVDGDTFEVTSMIDLAALPDLNTGEIQIAYHPASARAFTLAAQACPAPP